MMPKGRCGILGDLQNQVHHITFHIIKKNLESFKHGIQFFEEYLSADTDKGEGEKLNEQQFLINRALFQVIEATCSNVKADLVSPASSEVDESYGFPYDSNESPVAYMPPMCI